ncbi:2-methylcitrate dehydratase [Phycisphaerae bacterium RAS1]|nr:2-methylcitrate dehydratase [Phycisphaerae bacterium RAS1]
MTTLAHTLADRAKKLRFEDLSPHVVHEVKRRILDSIGCALGAWTSLPAKVTRKVAQDIPISNGAGIWASKHRTTPDLATFTNGALVRYLDFNDTYLSKEPAHPSDNIPPCLAAGQAAGSSPKEIIAAIALAYEVQCRLCDAASLRKHGWDHVYYGALSSALAAAKLYGLSPEQMVHALGIAGVCNFATRQTRTGQLSAWKACAFSNAARNGVFAAYLAKEGMTGPNEIFEGPKGLMKVVTGPFEMKWAAAPDDWMIRRTYIKFWPAEYHSQSAIDAALQLRPQIGDYRNITSILFESFEACVSIIGSEPEKWRPTSRETADHSMGFCVACALIDGDVTRGSFTDAKIRDAEVLGLLDKIRIVETPECNAGYPAGIPNNMIVKLKDGRELRKRVDFPRGHAGNPMTDEEVVSKFRKLAAGVVSEQTASRLVDACMTLDQAKDVAALFEFETAS